jgi:hypothetical protein
LSVVGDVQLPSPAVDKAVSLWRATEWRAGPGFLLFRR